MTDSKDAQLLLKLMQEDLSADLGTQPREPGISGNCCGIGIDYCNK